MWNKKMMAQTATVVLFSATVINCSQLVSKKDFNSKQTLIQTQSVLGEDNILQPFTDNPTANQVDGGSSVGNGGTNTVVGGTNVNVGGTNNGSNPTQDPGIVNGGNAPISNVVNLNINGTNDPTNNGGTSGGGTTGTGTNGTTGTNTGAVQTLSDELPLDLTINRLCSLKPSKQYHWQYSQASLLENDGMFVRITLDNQVLCTLTEAESKQQIIDGQLTIPNSCFGGLTREEFQSQLAYVDRSKPIKLQVIALRGTEEVQINDPKKRKGSNGPVIQDMDPSWVYIDRDQNNPNCDKKISPLFVDFRDYNYGEYRYSALSSPAQGVLFDLIGENVEAPQLPHQKVQVSWFKDANLMFIALPNAQGQINGINELFGDNTKVPVVQSGQEPFAANGFLALARYDGYVPADVYGQYHVVANGFIDANDYIYSQLRLWSDRNRNGQADAGELYTLTEMGVEYIDLRYDKDHKEMDQYKNEIRYKSAAKNSAGGFNLVFDVWFKLPK